MDDGQFVVIISTTSYQIYPNMSSWFQNSGTMLRPVAIFVLRAARQNSKLPTMLPSACVQVLPAFRSTKMSPGIASKTVSKGARESAQPMMAVWGACPSLTKAFLIEGVSLPEIAAPTLGLFHCETHPSKCGGQKNLSVCVFVFSIAFEHPEHYCISWKQSFAKVLQSVHYLLSTASRHPDVASPHAQ